MTYKIRKSVETISSIRKELLDYIMTDNIETVGEDLLSRMVFSKGQELQDFFDIFPPDVRATIVTLTKVFNDPDTYVDEDILLYKDKNGIYRKYVTFGNVNKHILHVLTTVAYEISQDYNYYNVKYIHSNVVELEARVYKLNLCLNRYKWYREEN